MGLKNKKAEGVFGMSFSMIFSIILVIFFIIAAFVAIKSFMGYQRCLNMNLFREELNTEVQKAYLSDGYKGYFNRTLSGIDYVCFFNFSSPAVNANNNEKTIFSAIKAGAWNEGQNFYFYSEKSRPCDKAKMGRIEHINLTSKNPICIKVVRDKVGIRIERVYESEMIKVSS